LEVALVPELPDIELYRAALVPRVVGRPLSALRIASPFVLRTVEPPASALVGRMVTDVRRLGKRIVLAFDDELFAVLHLMIAGRLRWKPVAAAIPRRNGLAAFDFPEGTLLLTEASRRQRASLHVVHGAAALATHDPGGLEVLDAGLPAFRVALLKERHTLKRALTDPRLVSGIGNAYSDEILHAARLSPLQLTTNLTAAELDRLYGATRETLTHWATRLRKETGDAFPDKVTAFRDGMAVHGRFRQPCPDCGTSVQRIRYAENEVNYCPACQTGGRVLADRALSRLLRGDWPRTIEELEARNR
jgi:formamidopyrimidine-DNA glycosylase